MPESVLELRPNCEWCDCDLPADSGAAMICTFECTFCQDCATGPLHAVCPNCGGNFEHRPIRPARLLKKNPASTVRINKARESGLPGQWSVYLLRCSDNSLYTGIATDVSRRLSEHENGKLGAKYLRGRGPFTLVFQQVVGDRSLASRIEHHIKRLSKREKEAFVQSPRLFRSHIQGVAEA